MTPRAFLVEIAVGRLLRLWTQPLADVPRHFAVWLARLFAGEPGVMLGTEPRDAFQRKAKRELGSRPKEPV